MRNVVFITQRDCPACLRMLNDVISPLAKRYPNNVSVHYRMDETMQRVNRRKAITKVPLIVIENDGEEDFRYSGWLSKKVLASIIESGEEVISLGEAIEESIA